MSATPIDELARYFDVDIDCGVAEVSASAPARYNVAPTDDVTVVIQTRGRRRLDTLRWGLLPFWAKDVRAGAKMINARADTLATSNAYRHAFRQRRCLVPADGFYEWKHVAHPRRGQARGPTRKQPVFVRRSDGDPMAMAGLWERWRPRGRRDDDSATVRSFTIVTGEPNALMAEVHDRMPVLLPPEAWNEWLDPANEDLEALARLLVPAPAELLVLHPVGTAVNDVRADGPELVEPISEDAFRTDGDDEAGGATQVALF